MDKHKASSVKRHVIIANNGSDFNVEKHDSDKNTEAIKKAQDLCRKRYFNSRKKYNEFFLSCIDEMEALQPSALAGVQVSRLFTSGVLPKYCKIEDPLTPKQRERVEQIING